MFSLLENYGSSSEDEQESEHLPVNQQQFVNTDIKEHISKINICPPIDESVIEKPKPFEIPPKGGQLSYNVKYDEIASNLNEPLVDEYGRKKLPGKNFLTGKVENVAINDFHFESQRVKFHFDGVAYDPSDNATIHDKVVRGQVR